MRRATYKVPHKGYSGLSANYVLHLAQDRGLSAGLTSRTEVKVERGGFMANGLVQIQAESTRASGSCHGCRTFSAGI